MHESTSPRTTSHRIGTMLYRALLAALACHTTSAYVMVPVARTSMAASVMSRGHALQMATLEELKEQREGLEASIASAEKRGDSDENLAKMREYAASFESRIAAIEERAADPTAGLSAKEAYKMNLKLAQEEKAGRQRK